MSRMTGFSTAVSGLLHSFRADRASFLLAELGLTVSNSERGYHVFSDVGTKLEFVGFNEAVHVRVATDIFSRIGLTRCLSDPYIPSAGCGDLIS